MRAAQSPSRAYLGTVNKRHAIFIDRADNTVSNAGIDNQVTLFIFADSRRMAREIKRDTWSHDFSGGEQKNIKEIRKSEKVEEKFSWLQIRNQTLGVKT